MSGVLDLCDQPGSRLRGGVLAAAESVGPGRPLELLLPEEPTLLLQSVNLRLGGRLGWRLRALAHGRYAVTLRLASETWTDDVVDLLERHHRVLDHLAARALMAANAGDYGATGPLMAEFAGEIGRHLRVEDEVLAPGLSASESESLAHPVAIMLREHAALREQIGAIQSCLAEGSAEAATLLGLLTGTLAKHEHREEANLFPLWRAALARGGAARCRLLAADARAILGP